MPGNHEGNGPGRAEIHRRVSALAPPGMPVFQLVQAISALAVRRRASRPDSGAESLLLPGVFPDWRGDRGQNPEAAMPAANRPDGRSVGGAEIPTASQAEGWNGPAREDIMMGGTDYTEGEYAARVLASERAKDAIYSVRAWARGIAWGSLVVAVCAAITGYVQGNDTALVAGLSSAACLLLPQCDPRVIAAIVSTVALKYRMRAKG